MIYIYNRILIPTDGSHRSDEAIEKGIALAKSIGARVTILYVIPKTPIYAQYDYSGPSYNAFLLEIEKFGIMMLDLLDEKYADSGMEIETKVRKGHPSHEICTEAKEGIYDLIVMASRGLGEIQGYLLGSISSKVVKYSDCSVLIIK